MLRPKRKRKLDLAFEHIQVCSWVVVSNYITATITGGDIIIYDSRKPLCVYKQESNSWCGVRFKFNLNLNYDPLSERISAMLYICACHLWWVMLCGESKAVCLPDSSGSIWCLGGGGVGQIWPFFIKTLLFCNCRWLLVPFYECFCRMWTCCTSSGLELKTRKVSKICTELFIVVYDGH